MKQGSIPYHVFPQFVLRTSIYPIGKLKELVGYLKTDLDALTNNRIFIEALFLASPSLKCEFDKLVEGKITQPKEREKLVYAILKYLVRMCTRPTPFGLFAGCTIGELGETTEFLLDDVNKFERHTRLDMNYLCRLSTDLVNNKSLRSKLLFYPNSTLYSHGDQYRYIEYYYQNIVRTHKISAIEWNEVLEKIISFSKYGATIDEISWELRTNELTFMEIHEFVESLIDNQILISELEPSTTGKDYADHILSTLVKIDAEIQEVKLFSNILCDLNNIDSSCFESKLNHYYKIVEQIKKLGTEFDLKFLFQTDLKSNALSAKFDRNSIKQIWDVITLLNKLFPNSGSSNLKKFSERFKERYGDSEIPLTLVLDVEAGIGYLQHQNLGDINILVDDLRIPKKEEALTVVWNEQQSFLLNLLLKSATEGVFEIEINQADVDKNISQKVNWDDLPDTIAAMISIVGQDKLGENIIYFHFVGGSSAANLLGRFCHGDPKINDLVNEIINKEHQLSPDVIHAEIVHLPESRTGNVLFRPALREYEIPYLGKSSVDIDHQICINDLMVTVKGTEVVLRSKRLNKRVVPHLTNAHNYNTNALPVYQFLCDLQTQGKRPGLLFSWGGLYDKIQYSPRLKYKNIIISPARWKVSISEVHAFLKIGNANDLLVNVSDWQNERKIPRFVTLEDGDNELFIDLSDILYIRTLLNLVKNRNKFILAEYLYDPETVPVKNILGGFCNELIICMYRDQILKPNQNFINNGNFKVQKAQRTFSPGSEWVFFKLYCGLRTADILLEQLVLPTASLFSNYALIDKWFFIRYADPENHLRIRFHCSSISNVGQVISDFNKACQPFLTNGFIHKIQIDSYEREINRYGDITVEYSESLFFYDSITICQLIGILEGDEDEKLRWLSALINVDTLLSDFTFSIDQKSSFIRNLRDAYWKEFGSSKELLEQINAKFRSHRKVVELFLDFGISPENEYSPIYSLYRKRSENNYQIITKMRQLINEMNQVELISSYLHMNLNRHFRSKQRLYELVIYDFLNILYNSKIARKNSGERVKCN